MAGTITPLVFLFIFGILHGEAHVPPPTNVTLHCHNLRNILHWSYDQLSPQIQFRVDVHAIKSPHQHLSVNSLHADISSLTDSNDDYFVSVTAVDGKNESEAHAAGGIMFSYFENSLSSQKCFVDLPSVNVTVGQDDNVEFRFPHPWLMYRRPLLPNMKSRKKKNALANITKLPEFTYSVVIVGQEETHDGLSCVESVCEQRLPVDGGQKSHCLRINGHLDKMIVRATQDYCALPLSSKTDHLYVVYILVGVFVIAALGLVTFMVYRKWTTPSSSFPSSMTITGQLKQVIMKGPLTSEEFAVAEVLPSSPTERPLLNTETEESTPANTPSAEFDFRLPIGLASQAEGVPDDVEVRGEGAEGSGYTQGRGLDDDVPETEGNSEDCDSGYEKRVPVVTQVELAPGDQAEGYHG